MMDRLIEELLEVRRQLRAELAELPLWKTLQEIEHFIDLRYAHLAQIQPVRQVPPGRLLCEIINEAKALDVWENEGGAIIPDPLPPDAEPNADMPIPHALDTWENEGGATIPDPLPPAVDVPIPPSVHP